MNLMEYPNRQAAITAVFEAVTGEKCVLQDSWSDPHSSDGVTFELNAMYSHSFDGGLKGYASLKLYEYQGHAKTWRKITIDNNELDIEKTKAKFQELKQIAIRQKEQSEKEYRGSVARQRREKHAYEEGKRLTEALGLKYPSEVRVIPASDGKVYKLTLLLKDEVEVRKLVSTFQNEKMG